MPQNRVATPIWISGRLEKRLARVPFEQSFSEERLQDLLFKHPGLLPIGEIEPLWDRLLPVARELPTDAGPIDLLYVNGAGHLTVVETKLWRNPESRRKVIGQIIDYAAELSKWTAEKLIAAASKLDSNFTFSRFLEQLKHADPEFDEAVFHDTLARDLREGKMLLLVVGDGIQEGLEQMVEFLKSPHLRFSLALVELRLYKFADGSSDDLLIQPSVLARTKEVTRAIVELKTNESNDSKMAVSEPILAGDEPRARLSAEGFLDRLAKRQSAATVEDVRWILANAEKHRLRLHWNIESVVLLYVDPTGYKFALGRISLPAQDVGIYLHEHCLKLRLPDGIAMDYYTAIQAIIPGLTIHREGDSYFYPAMPDGSDAPLKPLAEAKEKWFAAIDRAVARIAEEMSKRDENV